MESTSRIIGAIGREGRIEEGYLKRIEAALELALESELEHVHDLEITVVTKQRFVKLLSAVHPLVHYHVEHATQTGETVCIPRELMDALVRVTAEVIEA